MRTLLEPLYQVSVECMQCEATFATSRVRPSFKKGSGRDADFCLHYKDPAVNPDFYVVRVCPYCGFATTENFSNRMTVKQKENFRAAVASKWAYTAYGGERTLEDALKAYKLALLTAQIKEEKMRVVAGILHHIAWLYRFKQDAEQENKFLQFALDAYIQVYEVEGVDLNNARLMYLIGEINRRLRNYAEAIRWFSRVVNDKKLMDASMIQASREQWQVTREDMLLEKQASEPI